MGVGLVQEEEQAGLLRDSHIADCKRLVERGCVRARGQHVAFGLVGLGIGVALGISRGPAKT